MKEALEDENFSSNSSNDSFFEKAPSNLKDKNAQKSIKFLKKRA